MKSQEIDVETTALNPFILAFTQRIISYLSTHPLEIRDSTVIHADMIPKIHEKGLESTLGTTVLTPPRTQKPLNHNEQLQQSKTPVQKPLNQLDPFKKVHGTSQLEKPQSFVPPQKTPLKKTPLPPPIKKPILDETNTDPFTKIRMLLNDPSVTVIECGGNGKKITVLRYGQRQITRIILTYEEIKKILENISEKTHIPLMEGVFRAAFENYYISAVVSDIIGSRFVIRKAVKEKENA